MPISKKILIFHSWLPHFNGILEICKSFFSGFLHSCENRITSALQAEKADTQTEMDEWVHEFNTIRPHQALNGVLQLNITEKVPGFIQAALWTTSYRRFWEGKELGVKV